MASGNLVVVHLQDKARHGPFLVDMHSMLSLSKLSSMCRSIEVAIIVRTAP